MLRNLLIKNVKENSSKDEILFAFLFSEFVTLSKSKSNTTNTQILPSPAKNIDEISTETLKDFVSDPSLIQELVELTNNLYPKQSKELLDITKIA